MIEAVNSTLQNAVLLRASAEQSSNSDVFSANPAPQKIARAPSMSVYVDIDYDTAVLQFRNAETRDVIDQIPSETLLQARARDEARHAEVQAQQAQPRSEQPDPAPQQQQAQTAEIPAPSTPQTQTADAPAPRTSAPTQQQIAAFTSAANAGNTNAGFTAVTVYA